MEQKKLTKELSTAAANYYNSGVTIMSDEEFDIKKRRLQELESASGIIYPGSPTTVVGAKVIGKLSTAKHEQPALSLEKVNLSDPTAIQVITFTYFENVVHYTYRGRYENTYRTCNHISCLYNKSHIE